MRRPADTSVDAHLRRAAALRAMTPERRLALAAEMADEVLEITRAGLRSRNPALSDPELDDELGRVLSRSPARRRLTATSSTSAVENDVE